MKHIILVIAMLSITICSFAQKEQDSLRNNFNELSSKVLTINKTLVQYQDSVEQLLESNRNTIKIKSTEIEVLNQRLEQASNTISNQNSLFDGFGVLYSVITIVLAFFGLILPFIVYQFGIKPSRIALKELQTNIDAKIKQFLESTQEAQINSAISNLLNTNKELQNKAMTFLSLNQYLDFSDKQIFELIQILKSKKLEEVLEGQIAFLLVKRKHEISTAYFREVAHSSASDTVKYWAISYFANNGISSFSNEIVALIENAPDRLNCFYSVSINVASVDKSSVITFFNEKQIIDILQFGDLEKIKSSFATYLIPWRISQLELESTYLFKKLHD